jgi:SAM-dependent methyltransferase
MYRDYRLPPWLERRLPQDKEALIVDFGCGYGQVLGALRRSGYRRLVGVDVDRAALDACRAAGLEALDNRAPGALEALRGKARLVIASHVIEHFPKAEIIGVLESLRGLLAPGGELLIAVPNAQSHTAAYWAYEDFTHEYLFTSGSLYYVLKAAGFGAVELVDLDCLEGLSPGKRAVRRLLLSLYRANYRFWSRVTASATHAPSPDVFSFEIKALARN